MLQGQAFQAGGARQALQADSLLRIPLRHAQLQRLPTGLGGDKAGKANGDRRQQLRRVFGGG
ncbi:hypothetical protein D3C80_2102730 [compost metagenome]